MGDWPIDRPGDWVEFVNEAQTDAELEAIRASVKRGCSFGDEVWRERMVTQLHLEPTMRPRGRPRTPKAAGK